VEGHVNAQGVGNRGVRGGSLAIAEAYTTYGWVRERLRGVWGSTWERTWWKKKKKGKHAQFQVGSGGAPARWLVDHTYKLRRRIRGLLKILSKIS